MLLPFLVRLKNSVVNVLDYSKRWVVLLLNLKRNLALKVWFFGPKEMFLLFNLMGQCHLLMKVRHTESLVQVREVDILKSFPMLNLVLINSQHLFNKINPLQQTRLLKISSSDPENANPSTLFHLNWRHSPADDFDAAGQLKKKSKSNISRDYHDAEFRRLLLTLLNNNLAPQSQKTRLPRGFFGPYLEKNGLELVGLPEKPVEIGEGGKIGGWSADALRRNLEAVRANRVFIRRIDGTDGTTELVDVTMEEEPEADGEDNVGVDVDEEAARILAEGAGTRRGRRGAATAK